jgi:predicted nuclease of predicted toxin-antitoxin system
MKIKLDENIPLRLTTVLSREGHDVDTVIAEGLSGRPDDAVWEKAQSAGRFFITQDLDFSDIRKFLPGTHPGLLLIRLREPGANALVEKVSAAIAGTVIEQWSRCFVVLTDRKIRVKRP